jgi:hypothetical protein
VNVADHRLLLSVGKDLRLDRYLRPADRSALEKVIPFVYVDSDSTISPADQNKDCQAEPTQILSSIAEATAGSANN